MKTITSITMTAPQTTDNTEETTLESKRIAKRLVNHWKHKFEVAETDDSYVIYIPNYTVTLFFKPQSLDVQIDTPNNDTAQIEHVVLDHINRMAHKDFTATWTRSA